MESRRVLSATAASAPDAVVASDLAATRRARVAERWLIAALLAAVTLCGFGLRVYKLSAESLSEDELNKLRAVEDYRRRGLTSTNGEHPMLMKGLLTASVVMAERWNSSVLVSTHRALRIEPETALRLPGALLGAFASSLIFLLVVELFGPGPALIAAALWAFDPSAIGFNRIAKEDTFFLFFFLLANIFWLRGQRVAETEERNPEPFYWATAAAFGAMIASKYIPHLLAISAGYYYIFQALPQTRWRLGKRRWLIFFVVMGAVFLLCNPTIVLPDTWREMRAFAGERRIGHDAYEFMGQLYRNQMSLWLAGVPWTFYYVFMGVKLPLLTLVAFMIGLPLLFNRKLGDGRFFILFWFFFWFFPFTLLGGKFTRYFTFALPAVLITAAIGIEFSARFAARRFAAKNALCAALATMVVLCSLAAAVKAAPHYRLYTNALGGGLRQAGNYFPHDEFYDASVRDVARWLANNAPPDAAVFSETPSLVAHYLALAGRDDLRSLSLSDRRALAGLRAGDALVIARGRRYFSNDVIARRLQEQMAPAFVASLGEVPSARVFVVDEAQARALEELKD
ncbi:MAG: hypothetical protein C4334_10445 [Pyrinomonas sp.]|uniref:glycosyltransferase family 39 protein n=1 Tax=Pyrinomonas sp. TaxID=2080306 RepID=UPI00332080E8